MCGILDWFASEAEAWAAVFSCWERNIAVHVPAPWGHSGTTWVVRYVGEV